ncbi:hypothetical protein KKF34_02055 [Myxococcota bacterium]|nr:hypothetical protein [Myxococcota bacterium]MBU1495644.1 hypothetical protein [Myxococcota bacterium]
MRTSLISIVILLFAISCSHSKKETPNTTDTSAEKKVATPEPEMKPAPVTEKKPEPEVKKPVVPPPPPKKDEATLNKEYWETGTGPLAQKYVDIINTIDAKPTKAGQPEHYYVSNEHYYHLWYPYLKGLGGAYIGLAADTSYSLIVESGAKLVFLVDWDFEVNRTHQLFGIMLGLTNTPKEFIEYFKKKYNKKILEVANSKYDKKTADFIGYLHRRAANFIVKHHQTRLRLHKKGKASNYWLSDQKMFDAIKKVFAENRVFIFPGNLKDGDTITKIANICKKMNITVRTVYMSNAEEFWTYPAAFKASMLALPTDAKSVFLRTVVLEPKYSIGYKFHYTIQSGPDFLTWMRKKETGFSIKHIARKWRKPIDNTKYFSRLPAAPEKGI